ncbi:MAG: response regulator [Gemmatimonadetes bacterium]|nr:response regulator [Gemmatimonadota bacterium]
MSGADPSAEGGPQPQEQHELLAQFRAANEQLVLATLRAQELTEESQRARARAESADKRSAFLSEASAVLASPLEYRTNLASVARLAVPAIADCCLVEVRETDEGPLEPVAMECSGRSKPATCWDERLYPLRSGAGHGPTHVLRTGAHEMIEEISDAHLTAVARDPQHLAALRETQLTSFVGVPLRVRGRTRGVLTLLMGESGRHFGAADLRLAQDLARRIATALDIAQLFLDLQDANRAKDDFLATLSHELRTPLNAMVGWVHLLRSGKLDAERTGTALETIERNTRQQAQLISDLLDVSRIASGKLRLEFAHLDLAAVITDAIEVVQGTADARQIRIETDLASHSGEMWGDADRLQQVIWNLLSNAIKFTPPEGRVSVRLQRLESRILIEIGDTGRGIDPEFLPHVFERFRQEDAATSRRYAGLGLGLSIVRHLVELHGGTVRVESEGVDRGTTFTVDLPVRKTPRQVNGGGPHRESDPGVPPTALSALTGLRVLLVDDEADSRELVRVILEEAGSSVMAVRSAEEAMSEFERGAPDVVVSDIGMPDRDGYELIRRVRTYEAQRGTRVAAVALTGYARDRDRASAMRAGFDFHLAKPVQPEHLLATVARAAARSRLGPSGPTVHRGA